MVDIEYPLPGDTVGGTLVAGGEYDVTKAKPLVNPKTGKKWSAPYIVVCTLLQSDGMTPIQQQTTDPLPDDAGSWETPAFNVSMNYTDCVLKASLQDMATMNEISPDQIEDLNVQGAATATMKVGPH